MLEQLLAYQDVDKRLREIEKTLSESPERKKALNAKKYLDGATESVSKLDDRSAELANAFETIEKEQQKLVEQQSELENSLASAEDEKAMEYLIKKAEELAQKIKAIEEQISKISAEIQSIYKEYDGIKSMTQKAQVQYKENAPKYKALKDSLQQEKDEIESKLKELAKDVDPALMQRYLTKRADKIYPVIYAVRGDYCGHCNMELHGLAKEKLKKGEIIDCDQCRVMLYQKN
jgi:predicted  nucleic acid-binding Zn-ribbon protein